MKYPPQHHQEANFENCVYVAQQFPLATLISVHDGAIQTTHLPLMYQKNKSLGIFIGHIDKYNPQLNALANNNTVELIFHGPETYISPSIYQSTQLPTWNYFKAHFTGKPSLIKDQEKVKQHLINMTAFLEGDAQNFTLEAENPRMAVALDYIVGFEIHVEKWEGKHKISQDKHERDQQQAQHALQEKYPKQLSVIQHLYNAHQTKKS